jgi:carbohydrate kinase (thermoresistant glucokinase family)
MSSDAAAAGEGNSSDDATVTREPVVLVVMGVSGSGKSTVAALVAGRLGWPFEEGDTLHPHANIEKMTAGHPLTDEDRAPWLEKVAEWAEEQLDAGRSGLITCSCLKRAYRDVINRRGSGVIFVYLSGSRETIAERLATRHGHFMPPSLLASQFADLEEPTSDEPAIRIDVGPTPVSIAQQIVDQLHLAGGLTERERIVDHNR